jgi:hypothetical protein
MDDDQDQKPAQDLTQADAKSFLTANKIDPRSTPDSAPAPAAQPEPVPKAKSPIWLYVGIALFAIIIVAEIVHASASKPGAGNPDPSSILSVPTPDAAGTQSLDNQTKQDIKTCSNSANAALFC